MRKFLRAYVIVALIGVTPAIGYAQFGGLGKLKGLVDKAKAVKATVDSAKGVVDGVTGKAPAAQPASTPANTQPTAAPAATNNAASTSAPADPRGPRITEEVFAKFMRGAMVEKKTRNANPRDAIGAQNAGIAASGLTPLEYMQVKVKAGLAYAGRKNLDKPQQLVPAEDIPVLKAHINEIVEWMDGK